MPARTVVFSGIRKHDGRSFRDLLPGEYTQMSGRAGRRGLDATGVVIIACSGESPPDSLTLTKMLLGTPTKLESQFRLTYNMILNLLRVEALRVEEMIKRSFSENASQRMLPEHQKLISENELSLNALPKVNCAVCKEDIYKFYDIASRITALQSSLMHTIINTTHGVKALSAGRIVVINNSIHRNCVAVILKSAMAAELEKSTDSSDSWRNEKAFYCMVLIDKSKLKNHNANDVALPFPPNYIFVPESILVGYEIICVSYTSIVAVTKYSFRLDAEVILERSDTEEMLRVQQELYEHAKNVEQNLQETDWSKIRQLNFQECLKEKESLMKKTIGFSCTECSDFDEHYFLVHGERLLKQRIDDLRHSLSDQNLELLPDYEQRVEVLRRLQFVDANDTVQLKGRVACEINSADELILTELIFENTLAEFDPAEIVALLSCFVFQEKNPSIPNLTPKLERGRDIILRIASHCAQIQQECGVFAHGEENLFGLNFGLVEVVHEWAKGMPFKFITDLTDILEGSIVRCITRLDETCREVRGAARMIGDTTLAKKMEEAQGMIKRDIVFAASLYF
ncbi:uncharacterized protein VTP21DRAFT_10425 [Calcarisporiella thermophila]|uniref:uncharacterized protein n=1 Tax=Calcarisporiella thermophila TaxID=911321 RepID=UPI003743C6E0